MNVFLCLMQETRGQHSTRRWFEERTIRLTASRFGEICKATERRDKTGLARSYTVVKNLKTEAIKYGRQYESVAVEQYEVLTKRQTTSCGIFVSDQYPYLAATPDRVVDGNTIVEVKCPFAAKKHNITPSTVPYLKSVNGNLALDSNHSYYYQVQGQLFCSKRQYCDFVIFTQKDLKVVTIAFDNDFVDQMLQKLMSFYNDFFRDAVVKVHLFKDYDVHYKEEQDR